MDSNEIWKFISAALACTISLSKIGIPAVIAIYKSNYFMALLSSCCGAVFGTIVFTYFFAAIIKWWERFKESWFGKKHHKKKVFTKFNRRIITVKHRFGLTGIAIITPVLLSIPIGAFLAERFYKDKQKVIIYLSISGIAWCFIFYFSFLYFYDTIKTWF